MKKYEGIADPNYMGYRVLVDGEPLPLEPSLKIRCHSPSGFAWGYTGSGPSQLALALLLDHTGSATRAERCYQAFKFMVVAQWPQDRGWTLSSEEIESWLEAHELGGD